MNNRTIWILLAVAVVWYCWPKRAKKATTADKYDEAETILAGQSAIYPLDKPNLNGDVGVYA